MDSATPCGVGKEYGGQTLASASASQTTSTPAAKISWLTFFFTGILRIEGAIDLFAQLAEDFLGELRDVGILNVPRTIEIDFKLFLDAPGAEAHQQHAIAEAHRFAHVVRDED